MHKVVILSFASNLSSSVANKDVQSALVGSFSTDDGDGNENVKTAIGLLRKTRSSHVHHAFLYISLPLLHDYYVKMPNFTFYGVRKPATTKCSFVF